MHGCWQDLPSDLVRSIAERLSGVDDLVRLGAVCRPWSEALTGFRPLYSPPWLVLTATFRLKEVPIYCPNNYRVNRFPVPSPLPDGGSSRVVGSHHGWLVTVDDASLDFLVFNPLTGDRPASSLPSFSTLNTIRAHVKKVALSSVPSSSCATGNDVVAAAIYRFDEGEAIAFAKAGDDTWSGSVGLRLRHRVKDVIYYRGNFLVVSFGGQYQIINPGGGGGPLLDASWIVPPIPLQYKGGVNSTCVYFNLVLSPSSGHLLVVGRVGSTTIGSRLVVREFNPDADPDSSSSSSSSRWVEIKDLGDESLFFSRSHAMLLPVGSNNYCSSSRMVRRNCIYFIYWSALPSLTIYTKDLSSTVELFDLEKGVFESSPFVEHRSWMRYWKKPLFWFLPSLS